MAWNRNDFIPDGLIGTIILEAVINGLTITGNILSPVIVIPFQK